MRKIRMTHTSTILGWTTKAQGFKVVYGAYPRWSNDSRLCMVPIVVKAHFLHCATRVQKHHHPCRTVLQAQALVAVGGSPLPCQGEGLEEEDQLNRGCW